MPAQFTTCSVSTVPRSVTTPVTRPAAVRTPVTATPSTTRAPRLRAPRASDMHTSTGLARPSSATRKPASTSSVRANGHSAATSAGEISWSSTPKPRANAASRRSASSLAGVVASEMWPIGRNPVARPVSASSRSYRSRE